MARIFRATYTVTGRSGERVTRTAKKWYVEFVDADGSVGVHNASYTRALLDVADTIIAELTPQGG